MNDKVIFEIGDLIHIKYKLFRKLTANEIINTFEYKHFKNKFPNICMLSKK